ncbi:MAG: hypothetical protein C0509_04910 [Acinetobacter sp.]|nr:hypothetical protein [Acinetobacter sp.]
MTNTHKPTPSVKPAVANLRQDLNNIKQDVRDLAEHAVEAGAENAAKLRAEAAERLEYLKDAGTKNMARVEKRIREKPAQSLAIAFGAGILLSLLFGRK